MPGLANQSGSEPGLEVVALGLEVAACAGGGAIGEGVTKGETGVPGALLQRS